MKITEITSPPCLTTGVCDLQDAFHEAVWREAAYEWMALRTGFWPLWLAVGTGTEDREITGYGGVPHTRPAIQPQGRVLFSWRWMPERPIVYSEWLQWDRVISAAIVGDVLGAHRSRIDGRRVTKRHEDMILRPEWTEEKWLAYAAAHPRGVQAVVPSLDLRTADEVWVHNEGTRAGLVGLGFQPQLLKIRDLEWS